VVELGGLGSNSSRAYAIDGSGFERVGKGEAAAAKAVTSAKGNSQDDLVVVVGQDVYAATSKQIKVDRAKDAPPPRFDQSMVIRTKSGESLAGVVKLFDTEASDIINRREAAKAREQRIKTTKPFVIVAAVAALGGAVVGWTVPALSGAAGLVAAIGAASVYGLARYQEGIF